MRDWKIKLISLYNYYTRTIDIKSYLPYGAGVVTAFLRDNNFNVTLEDLSPKIENYNKKFWFSSKRTINLNILREEKKILDYVCGYSVDKKVEEFVEQILHLTSFEGYNLVGVSVMSYFHFLFALLLSKKIKSKMNTKVVLGGPFITLHGKELSNYFVGDYMIVGDGQIPMLKLIEYLNGRISVKEVPNLIYRENGIVKSNPREFYSIEHLSMPDFTDLPLNFYRSPIDRRLVLAYQINSGCTNNCSYCNNRFLAPYPKFKSFNKVVTELKIMKTRYRSNSFYFCDEAINCSYKYLDKLCDIFIEEKLGLLWGSYAKVHNLDKKILHKMRKAGCEYLKFGIESGSNRILKGMNKRFTIEQASQALKDSYQEGIKNHIHIIVGYPHETGEDVAATIEFIRKNSKYIDTIRSISACYVTYGSPLYNNPGRFGIENLRPTVHISYVPLKHFAFDEIRGLTWKEKLKQQEYAYKMVLKAYFKYVLSKYYIGLIPFWLYAWLRRNIDQLFGGRFFQLFVRFHPYLYMGRALKRFLNGRYTSY